jgi:hypothetical protein
MRRFTSLATFVFAILPTLLGETGRGDTIAYTNFGLGHSYNTSTGLTIDSRFSQGGQFTATASGALSEIIAALVWFNSQPAHTDFTLSLYADSSNTLGALLGSYGGVAGADGTVADILTPSSGVTITSGQKYWLVASSPNEDVWASNDQGATAINYYHDSAFDQTLYFPGNTLPAFEVYVAVPEPSTLALVSVAAAAAVLVMRRHT